MTAATTSMREQTTTHSSDNSQTHRPQQRQQQNPPTETSQNHRPQQKQQPEPPTTARTTTAAVTNIKNHQPQQRQQQESTTTAVWTTDRSHKNHRKSQQMHKQQPKARKEETAASKKGSEQTNKRARKAMNRLSWDHDGQNIAHVPQNNLRFDFFHNPCALVVDILCCTFWTQMSGRETVITLTTAMVKRLTSNKIWKMEKAHTASRVKLKVWKIHFSLKYTNSFVFSASQARVIEILELVHFM